MKSIQAFLAWLVTVFCFSASISTQASSIQPLTADELVRISGAVFRGKVVSASSFRGADNQIYTRTSLRVDEAFKGTFPAIVQVVHRGGQVGNEDDFYGLSPRFTLGEECLLFVIRRADGKLQATQGYASAIRLEPVSSGSEIYVSPGADWLAQVRSLSAAGVIAGDDVTDQAAPGGPVAQAITGMLNGVNSRFIQPDRGEPIPYLIDADSLPAGMSLTQATNAVRQAFDAWAAVTSLKFKLEGIQSFGQSADTILANDEKIRIQLHDNYGTITSASVLGVGGRGASSAALPSGWDIGGNVAGTEFRKTSRGYVVLKASNASLQNIATFTEVLCHEIGHALNLAHSSEVVTSDPLLSGAMMYFLAHSDGRGATLGAYDPPVIRQIYPPDNTPPFAYDRVMDVTTATVAPNISGINEVDFHGYDLQNTALTVATNGASANNGAFSVVGTRIKYTPDAAYSDSPRGNPVSQTYYDFLYARVSDGTNASPYAVVGVVSYARDSGNPSDGIPDSWMVKYFGHSDPRSADKSRASDDADGDKLTTLQEYLAGSNPKDAASAQRITSYNGNTLQFQARAYEVYELLGSTNLSSWSRFGAPFVPKNATDAQLTAMPQTNITAVISNLQTSEPQMFFRVRRAP